ncbi:kinesin-like protein KIN-14R [Hordeum vulgare subsp. vulgare]|uniref:Kinesin-like protein n=1 Tax=Hordeum vulgare subsp. vulgare TaxID=112509 RepID=A0A8I7BDM6_HORVV|nr:kinesin-like protein KIN-14R [Hordeum vulgare subsp. vulgare]
MEEGSSEAAVRDGGALSAPSVGTEAVARKTVKMSETRDFIPCADASEGDSSRSSGSSAAAADVASCTGSSEAALPDDDADADAEMHHTPDYARRGAAGRLRIAPLELFSAAAPSPPAVPRPPAKPAFAESAAAPEAGAGGGAQEEATGAGRQIAQHVVAKGDGGDCCGRLRQEYDSLLREKGECRRVLEDLMRENELKTKECREAQTSLRDLQMELMRKSMHVGSLAFAVEGQVKEKTRWCQLLKDLSEKFKALKTEHQILLKESEDYKKCLSDATQMTTTIHQYVSQYASLESEFKDLKEKFSEEAKERKDLYNKLIELKGNIRVFCRCRPLNTEETAEGASMAIDFESAKDGELIVRGHVSSKKVFKFDSVFNPEEDQEKVFEKTAPFATSVLDGFNVCIFAYGQTGTGKTFTMEGTEGARGVNYRILDELFRVVKDRHDLFQYEITVSALEVYNEQIHDLLLTGSQPSTTTKRLEVRQVAEGVHHVPGLVEARVTNMDEAWDVLQTGSKARVVGSTNANEHSSRSHCIHCVMVKGENLMNGERTNSKLWLIDLAGSERVAKTDAQGERLKEAQNINKSLSALGDVISALATKSQHIPFRNSKLTHLLQDSLSGDSKTLMFVQISPNENDVGETLCSLNFASRVRGIELGQARKQVDVGELSRYKLMVGRAKQDCKSKDAQIKSMEETIQSLEAKNKAKDLLTMNLQDKIKELESQLLVERKIARQHVDNKIAQDVERKQQQQSLKMEESNTHLRSPMSERNLNATAERPPPSAAPRKDLGMMAKQPFSDSNNNGDTYSFNQLMSLAEEKENANPDAAARARRVSLCNGGARQHPANTRRSSLIPLPRRNSLMPLGAKTPAPPPAAAASPLDKIKEYSSPPLCSPPVMSNDKGSRSKRINLRRSLQKKVVIRPAPSGQPARRAGAAAAAAQGIDSARRAAARRVPVSGGGAPRGGHQNRDKERGWNH